jgi:hypothetical protein
MSTKQTTPDSGDSENDTFGWNISFSVPEPVVQSLDDGFNRYGVREHDDGSIDVIFAAMEPGIRHEGTPLEVEITDQFLSRVASHSYPERIPFQYDHSRSQRANVGWVYGNKLKFSDGFFRVMAHIPNTGSQIRSDTIADFTHDPPAISDGSVGFDPRTIEVERPSNRDEKPVFTDARLQEFSLTPFPAGYDDGGLTPAFSDVVSGAMTPVWGESRLTSERI